MREVLEILNRFSPISLDDMSGIRLMNRTDTKFVATVPLLKRLLELAHNDYMVQEINNSRIAQYQTVYFDTDDRLMYVMHQNGHTNRQKLRIRTYVDSATSFLEVKTKNNRGRTKKKRVALTNYDHTHHNYEVCLATDNPSYANNRDFLRSNLHLDISSLKECLENRFKRITLVNNNKTERLTIDLDLKFNNLTNQKQLQLPQLVIIELKRDGLTHSPILEFLRLLRIHPCGFSKYCMGSAMTDLTLKRNLIKSKIHRINNILEL